MMYYDEYLLESENHKLSGVVLIYNNKILLVRPKKFRRRMKKWSIPKGHIEGKMNKMRTALHELEEESRIKLKKKHLMKSEKSVVNYFKAGASKTLSCYVVKVGKEDLNVRLFNDMILGNFLKGETVEAGFFVLVFLFVSGRHFEDFASSQRSAEFLQAQPGFQGRIICSKMFLRGVRFYTDKQVALVSVGGAPLFSPHPVPVLDSDEKIKAFLRSQPVTYCVIDSGAWKDIQRVVGAVGGRGDLLRMMGNQYIVRVSGLNS